MSNETDQPTNNGCEVGVFIELTDSFAEIRKRAIEAAQAFLKTAAAAEPIENRRHKNRFSLARTPSRPTSISSRERRREM